MTPILTYDEALAKTFRTTSSYFKAPYQIIVCLALVISTDSKYPLVAGLSFLEKVPNKYECLQSTSHTMTSDSSS